jgi:S1-C subfamily serine protease
MNSSKEKTMIKLATSVLVTILIISSTFAANQNRTMIVKHDTSETLPGNIGENDLLHIPELSALIAGNAEQLTVDHVIEPEMRAKGYEKTDVQEGDVIFMVNGKKLNKLSDLKEIYNLASIGSTVKLGIKRNKQMMIASFVKADPKSMPKMRMMISHGDDEDFLGIPQIGLRFSSTGKDVVVKEVLPNASTELPDVDVKEGDAITKINGSSITSFKTFEKAYKKIHAGERVELVAKRGGKSQTIVFPKPKDNGHVIIRRQGR